MAKYIIERSPRVFEEVDLTTRAYLYLWLGTCSIQECTPNSAGADRAAGADKQIRWGGSSVYR